MCSRNGGKEKLFPFILRNLQMLKSELKLQILFNVPRLAFFSLNLVATSSSCFFHVIFFGFSFASWNQTLKRFSSFFNVIFSLEEQWWIWFCVSIGWSFLMIYFGNNHKNHFFRLPSFFSVVDEHNKLIWKFAVFEEKILSRKMKKLKHDCNFVPTKKLENRKVEKIDGLKSIW